MENYAEIFGGFVASSSIPVLVLPEAVDGFKEDLPGSQSSGLNYLEIFGVLDAGTFSLSYEELLVIEKGSKEEGEAEEDGRFFEDIDVGQVETRPSELSVEVPVGGHIIYSKVNQISSSFHLNDKEINFAGKSCQEYIVDEVGNTICASRSQDNCGPNLEAEIASPTGFVEKASSINVESDDHILNGRMEEESETVEHSKIFHRCLVGATVDSSENDLIDAHKPPFDGAAYYFDQHSPSSSYHSTSSGDISFSDYAFLTISDINLCTKPLKVPPPLRAPPNLDTKLGMPKSEALGGSRTRQALKETIKSTFPLSSNVDEDVSKAAADSAAAMIEAMEQAQARLKSAKELMVRKRESPHSDRRLDMLQNADLNKVEKLNTFRLTENKMFLGGELLQMQDGKSTKLKSGIIINKEVMNIFETPARDDGDKEKMPRALQVSSDDIKKLVDPIQLDRNANELKHEQESGICAVDTNNADHVTKPHACERNGSGLMGFCMDGKLDKFDGDETPEKVKEAHLYGSNVEEISDTSVVFEYDALRSDDCMGHSRSVNNCNLTSEFDNNKKFKEAKFFSLQNAIEVEVDVEYRTLFSCDEKNMEATSAEYQFSILKQTKTEALPSHNDGKDSELKDINNASKQEKRSFSGIGNTSEQVNKQRAKWKIPNWSDLNIAKPFVQPVCIEKTKETSKFQQNAEKNVYELLQKFENYEGRLTADGEQRNDENKFLGKVQTALDLEKKIIGLSATQKVFQGINVQDSKAVQRANSLDDKGIILSPSEDASKSSWKQMEKNIPGEWRDANNVSKEILDRERKHEAEQKRKLAEKERAREREKDMISIEKVTRQTCERVFAARERSGNIVLDRYAAEARQRPITAYRDIMENSSAEVFERSEKVANDANSLAGRAAVERVTAEAREHSTEKSYAQQASHGARSKAGTSGNYCKDKTWKHNESEGMVRPGNKDSGNSPTPNSDVNDVPIDMKSQSKGCEGESPLRCKARQERCQRMVERAAKALAEKNMRDLLAQREQAERIRLAVSLDAEVRRWSSGKEGNLRALLSTLQYILGHDSGWQPISLTEIVTAAAIRKVYRKATLYVHPDKLQQRGATIQQKYICEKVFDLLKDAWNKFNSEG